MFNHQPIKIEFNDEIRFTELCDGNVEELRTAELLLVEKSSCGDLLCVVNEGQYLVDIDSRDIKNVRYIETLKSYIKRVSLNHFDIDTLDWDKK